MYIGKLTLAYPNPNDALRKVWYDPEGIIQKLVNEYDDGKRDYKGRREKFFKFTTEYYEKLKLYFDSRFAKLIDTLTMYKEWKPESEPFNFVLSKDRLNKILSGGKDELEAYNELARDHPHIAKYGKNEAKGNELLKTLPDDLKKANKRRDDETIGAYSKRINAMYVASEKAKAEEEAKKAKPEEKKEEAKPEEKKEEEDPSEESISSADSDDEVKKTKPEEKKEEKVEPPKFETLTDAKTGKPLPSSIDPVPPGLFPSAPVAKPVEKSGLDTNIEILNELKKISALLSGSRPSSAQPTSSYPMSSTQQEEAIGSYPMTQQSLQDAINSLKHVIPNVKEVIPTDEEIETVKNQIENFDRSKLRKYRAGLSTNYLEYYNYLSDTNRISISNFIKLNDHLARELMNMDDFYMNLNNENKYGDEPLETNPVYGGLKDKILNSIPGVSTLYQIFKTVYPIIRPAVQKLHGKYIEAFNEKAKTDKDLVPLETPEKGMISRDQLDRTLKEDIHMKPLSIFNGILNGKC